MGMAMDKRRIKVLTVPGTWSRGTWGYDNSDFSRSLTQRLESDLGYENADIEVTYCPWQNFNRMFFRAKAVQEMTDRLVREMKKLSCDELLLVAHSHGGNIAVEAARNAMGDSASKNLAMRIVCLNTPFIKIAARSSSTQIWYWFVLVGLLATFFGLGLWGDLYQLPAKIDISVGQWLSWLPNMPVSTPHHLMYLLLSVCLLSAILGGLALSLPTHDDYALSSPRPQVLCLSTIDDEVNTLMGYADGVANLPQILLHPLGAVLLGTLLSWSLFASGYTAICSELACVSTFLVFLSIIVAWWLFVALVGGGIGAAVLLVTFGLTLRQCAESMASRLLVSFVPLGPANAVFRPLRIHKFFSHSAAYRRPETINEIITWLMWVREPARPV